MRVCLVEITLSKQSSMHSVLAFCECSPVGYGREAAIMLWCFQTINHRLNQLSGVISTSTDTFTGIWYSPCGKVVKLKLSRAMNRSNYVSVITANPAHCYTTTGTSLQLAQISHPTARTVAAVGGVKIVTPQGVQKPGLDHFCVRVSSLSAIHDKSA